MKPNKETSRLNFLSTGLQRLMASIAIFAMLFVNGGIAVAVTNAVSSAPVVATGALGASTINTSTSTGTAAVAVDSQISKKNDGVQNVDNVQNISNAQSGSSKQTAKQATNNSPAPAAFNSKRAPIIGISAGAYTAESGSLLGKEYQEITDDYVQAVTVAGGIPIILPMVDNEEVMRQQIAMIDGLVISGGHDVNPLIYGEEPLPSVTSISVKRDYYEIKIIRLVAQQKKPILGICRGMQIINVAFGGTLYQDISQKGGKLNKHLQQVEPDVATHTVDVKPGNLLRDILKVDAIVVNSFHHQAVKGVAPGFTICAQGRDEIIECIVNSNYKFMLGVQWHPEILAKKDKYSRSIFDAFIAAAGAGNERR